MKRSLMVLTFFSICVVSSSVCQQAAKMPAVAAPTSVPALVPFAGSAVDGQGNPPGESAAVTFRIYKDEHGGEPVWSERQPVQLDAAGHYKVELGAASPAGIPIGLFGTGEARWLDVEVAGLPPQPRVLLASVPYALKAADAETLAGRAAVDYVTREDLRAAVGGGATAAALPHPDTGPTGSGTGGFVPLWTGTTTLGSSVISETGTKIGIDTATPAATLDVNGTTTLEGNTSMPALGTATASSGFSSPVFAMSGSSFQNGGAAVNQKFAWEIQTQGNNTAKPSSVLSLLYASGTNGLGNTGFSILPSGSISTESNVTVLSSPATAATGNFSSKVDFEANAFNSSTARSVPLNFAFSALPVGNNTPNPSANLSLEFASGSGVAPTATGLSFSPAGLINFVPSQTFPGTGTITGITTTNPLTGGANSGSVSLGIDMNQLDTTLDSRYIQVGTSNFPGPFTVTGQFNATDTVEAGNGFVLGGFAFETGNGNRGNAFLGFSYNTNATGFDNLGAGDGALGSLTGGSYNIAAGVEALGEDTIGNSNTAVGWQALIRNTIGSGNTAVGYSAGVNSTDPQSVGSNNTFIGYQSGPGIGYSLINATAIGANAVVTENNALVLGGAHGGAVSVGIGTTAPYPDYGLDIEALESNGINGGVVVNASGGNLYLGMTNGTPEFRVDTGGQVHAVGGFVTSNADFAESVAVRGQRSQYEPGDLMAIDPGGARRLALARTPYSTLVAGIYSTKPGVLASPHDNDDPRRAASEVPLAVVGIVPCKVTAENGPIRIGDLLVTSSRAGYAMKGKDRKRLVGAVVGKALEPLAKGTGAIQVLVTLQ